KPGDREEALRILDGLLKNRGRDPETLGIKGRIHKDMYTEAAQAKKITTTAVLDDAIDAYTKGFESDPRDYYPGVNAINLLIQKGDATALKEAERLLPLVSFAVARRGGASSSDYWDIATALELACIGEDWPLALRILPRALIATTNSFSTQTTLGHRVGRRKGTRRFAENASGRIVQRCNRTGGCQVGCAHYRRRYAVGCDGNGGRSSHALWSGMSITRNRAGGKSDLSRRSSRGRYRRRRAARTESLALRASGK